MKNLILLLALLVTLPVHARAMDHVNTNAAGFQANSDTVYDYALASNTAVQVTWPTGATALAMTCPAAYWTSRQAIAAVPSTTVTNGSGAAYRGSGEFKRTRGVSETSFYTISATAQECSVEFWGY